jgi:hypothetical protein
LCGAQALVLRTGRFRLIPAVWGERGYAPSKWHYQ